MIALSDRLPIRMAILYVLVAGIWILLSDYALVLFIADGPTLGRIQTYKGFLFVVVTAGLLYGILRQYLLQWERENEQRRQAELALYESEVRLRNMAANLPGAIFRYVLHADDQDSVTYMSPGCRELWEVEPEAVERDVRVLWNLVHPDDLPRLRESIALSSRTHEQWQGIWRVTTPSGRLKWVQAAARFVREENGGVSWDAVVLDVTERERAELELRQLNEQLERRVSDRTAELDGKNHELETFTYTVSHDLKAPLRGINGYSQLLLAEHAEALPEEPRMFLEHIHNLAREMNQLIDDLLAYSRLENQPKTSQDIELLPFIQEVTRSHAEALASRGGSFDLSIPAGSLRADPQGLTLALRNLLDNAVKFTHDRPQPKVEVRAWRNEDSWTIMVRDNGIGFEMEYHDRIFQIFQRLQRSEDFPGTGVGLAIVGRAMKRMGGHAWAESRLGEGASFFLCIPDLEDEPSSNLSAEGSVKV